MTGDGPLVVREKSHPPSPMTLDQALYEMELVGHDFYLFVDKESERPSVVYRRRGYDYGVISLDLGAPADRSAPCDGGGGPVGPPQRGVTPPVRARKVTLTCHDSRVLEQERTLGPNPSESWSSMTRNSSAAD